MTEQEYQDILKQIMDRRNAWPPEESKDVPQTLPDGPALGKELILPLHGRNIRVLYHKPNTGKAMYPVYFNYHGGGMSCGKVEGCEPLCKQISEDLDCIVVNVEYRLAPEHPFPQGLNDAYDTIVYMLAHAQEYQLDAEKVAMGGPSAGGNLAVAVGIMANRSKAFKYCGVSILYAALKFFETENTVPSDVAIPKKTSALYIASYAAGGGDMHDPLASPLCASPEDIRDTPSMLIITAELDTLRTDSEIYAKMLVQQGVPVIFKQFMNCVHGFNFRAYKEEPQQATHMIETYLENIWA